MTNTVYMSVTPHGCTERYLEAPEIYVQFFTTKVTMQRHLTVKVVNRPETKPPYRELFTPKESRV